MLSVPFEVPNAPHQLPTPTWHATWHHSGKYLQKKILPQFHLPPFNPLSLPLSISPSLSLRTTAVRHWSYPSGRGRGWRGRRQSAWRDGGEGGRCGMRPRPVQATCAGGVHRGGAAAAARDAVADVVRRRPARATAIVVARRWTRGRSTPVRQRPAGFG